MKKWIKRILLVGLAILLVGGGAVYLNLNRIIRSVVQTQASSSLNLPTTLAGAQLGLMGGTLQLNDLEIASPKGFAAPQMVTLQQTTVQVNYSQLRNDPVEVVKITLVGPRVVIEQVGGKLNLRVMADQIPQSPPDAKPMKLVISELNITDATVVLRPGLPGLSNEMTLHLPAIQLTNIGNASGQNGATIQEVVTRVLNAIAAKVSDSGQISGELSKVLNLNVKQIAGQIGQQIQQGLSQPSVGNLTHTAGNAVKNATGQLENLFHNKKSDDPSGK